MKRKAGGRKAQQPSLVLVFGENEHDTKAIAHLAEAARPELRRRIQSRRQPLVLIKNAKPENARSNAQKIAGVVKQESAARHVAAVLAHEDCDALEPAHLAAAARIEGELQAAGCPGAIVAVTPAWEIETWWMVFPDAVAKVVSGWRRPDDWLGKAPGKTQRNAKEALAQAVQPKPRPAKPPRAYEENDSVAIAQHIRDDGLLASFQKGMRVTQQTTGVTATHTQCASLDVFIRKLLAVPA